MYCFFNDRIVPQGEALVPITDLGFLRGYGVFDLALAQGTKVFLEQEHLKRLENSAKRLSLQLPYSLPEISRITRELLERNNLQHSVVRWVLSGGTSAGGLTVGQVTFAILIEPYHQYGEEFYTKGVNVITVSEKREIPEAKSFNYQILYSLYPRMKEIGAFEIIYTPHNQVLEAGTSSVFIIQNGTLITPQKDILPGITRQVIIRLAGEHDIPVTERSVTTQELFTADEVFISATNKRIMPVVKIDTTQVGDGTPGPLTRKLISIFAEFEKRYFS